MLFKIMTGVSLGISLILVGVIIYLNMTKQQRVDENRKWLKETIIEEVYKQIKFVMPKESGGVYVPNK